MSQEPPSIPGRPTLREQLGRPDGYGIALVLVLATIVVLALVGDRPLGQFAAVALGGGTLLFILHTSQVHRRTLVVAWGTVAAGLAVTGFALVVGGSIWGPRLVGLVGLLLALVAPLAIIRRIASRPTITMRAVLGALCVYLLVGLFFSYVYPLAAGIQGQPFFAQPVDPSGADFLYFSYTTLTTVGYGDLSAGTDLGRMLAVSEALLGQIYLVSAVAFLVANIGRSRRVRTGEGSTAEPPE